MVAQVIRKTLDGASTAFTFSGTTTGGKVLDATSCRFLVKNFGSDPVYVDFADITAEADAIKIPGGTAQICMVEERGIQARVNTIYVKGTGEVEVQAL